MCIATLYYENVSILITFPQIYLAHNTYTTPYRFFIVDNFAKNYLHKNVIFSTANVFTKSIAFMTKMSTIQNYDRFFKFFFFNFLRNQKLFFCSFKIFFFEFLNFNSYLNNVHLYTLYKPLFLYYQEKKNRRKFIKLIFTIFKRYRIKALVLFDYKYSSFFLKVLRMTGTILIGFNYNETSDSYYHYSLFIGGKDILVKHLIFNQIFDIYKLAMFYRNEFNTIKFILLYRNFE
jgi:hypothetical protein